MIQETMQGVDRILGEERTHRLHTLNARFQRKNKKIDYERIKALLIAEHRSFLMYKRAANLVYPAALGKVMLFFAGTAFLNKGKLLRLVEEEGVNRNFMRDSLEPVSEDDPALFQKGLTDTGIDLTTREIVSWIHIKKQMYHDYFEKNSTSLLNPAKIIKQLNAEWRFFKKFQASIALNSRMIQSQRMFYD